MLGVNRGRCIDIGLSHVLVIGETHQNDRIAPWRIRRQHVRAKDRAIAHYRRHVLLLGIAAGPIRLSRSRCRHHGTKHANHSNQADARQHPPPGQSQKSHPPTLLPISRTIAPRTRSRPDWLVPIPSRAPEHRAARRRSEAQAATEHKLNGPTTTATTALNSPARPSDSSLHAVTASDTRASTSRHALPAEATAGKLNTAQT